MRYETLAPCQHPHAPFGGGGFAIDYTWPCEGCLMYQKVITELMETVVSLSCLSTPTIVMTVEDCATAFPGLPITTFKEKTVLYDELKPGDYFRFHKDRATDEAVGVCMMVKITEVFDRRIREANFCDDLADSYWMDMKTHTIYGFCSEDVVVTCEAP